MVGILYKLVSNLRLREAIVTHGGEERMKCLYSGHVMDGIRVDTIVDTETLSRYKHRY